MSRWEAVHNAPSRAGVIGIRETDTRVLQFRIEQPMLCMQLLDEHADAGRLTSSPLSVLAPCVYIGDICQVCRPLCIVRETLRIQGARVSPPRGLFELRSSRLGEFDCVSVTIGIGLVALVDREPVGTSRPAALLGPAGPASTE